MSNGFTPDVMLTPGPNAEHTRGFTPHRVRATKGFTPDEQTPRPRPSPPPRTPASLHTISTYHGYDRLIVQAAMKHHIDPNVLRLILWQETRLGQSSEYDPRTGLSRTPGNAGHGLGQLDPASLAAPGHLTANDRAILARAAHDPAFAINYTAGMIHNGLVRNHGDVYATVGDYGPADNREAYTRAVFSQHLDPLSWNIVHGRLTEVAQEHNRHILRAAGDAHSQNQGFFGYIHNVAVRSARWFAHPLLPIEYLGASLDPPVRTNSVTSRIVNNALFGLAVASEPPMEAINASMRNLAANPRAELAAWWWPTRGNLAAEQRLPGSQALAQTLYNPHLPFTQKFITAFNELGVNSPGEISYWAQQPGIEDLLHHHATTPQGAFMAWLMTPRVELARLKPYHPWLTGAETGAIELFNLTPNFLVHGATSLIDAVRGSTSIYGAAFRAGTDARNASEATAAYRAADQARRSWVFGRHSTELSKPLEQNLFGHNIPIPGQLRLPGQVPRLTGDVPGTQLALGPPPEPFTHDPSFRAWFERQPTPPEASSVTQEVHGGLLAEHSREQGNYTPGGLLAPREPFSLSPYTSSEEALGGEPPRFVPSGTTTYLLHKLGYNSPQAARHLISAAGRAWDRLAERWPYMPIIGDRYFHFSKRYGPVGEWTAANFTTEHANARAFMRNQAQSPQVFGNLHPQEQEQLAFTIDNLADIIRGNITNPSIDFLAPRGGVGGTSFLERALHHNSITSDQFYDAKRLGPVSGIWQLERKPDTIDFTQMQVGRDARGNPLNTLNVPSTTITRAVQQITGHNSIDIFSYHPRYSTWEGTEARGALGGAGGGLGGVPMMRPRTLGPLDQAIEEGSQIAMRWNPAGDTGIKWGGMENFLTMLRQYLDTGRSTVVPGVLRDGRPVYSVEPITYEWPGGREYSGETGIPGNPTADLSQPYVIGVGPEGYATLEKWEQEVGPHYLDHHPGGDARTFYSHVTTNDRARIPAGVKFETRPGQILSAKELNGYKVEQAFFHQVADANPRVRYSLGLDGGRITMRTSLGQMQQAYNDLDIPTDRIAQAHFISDQSLEDYMDHQDVMGLADALARQSAMLNPGFHVEMNTAPSMWYLLAQQAGVDPVKLTHYSAGLMKALGAAMWHGGEDLVSGVRDVPSMWHGMPHQTHVSQLPLWVEKPEWFDKAQAYNVFSRGISSGISAADEIRLMATPFADLSPQDMFLRRALIGSQMDKGNVFGAQERSVLAYTFHVLTDEEGIDPRIAARMINRSANDFDNVTGPERAMQLNKWTWFYTFGKMMLRRSYDLLMHDPRVPTAVSHGIYSQNQASGNPNPSSTSLTLYRKADGSYQMMSVPWGAQRYANDTASLMTAGGGNISGLLTTGGKMITNHLSPLGMFTARLAANAYQASPMGGGGIGKAPQSYSAFTGLGDIQASAPNYLVQAGEMMAQRVMPYGMFTTYQQLPAKRSAEMYGLSVRIRDNARRMKKNGESWREIQTGIDYAERLEKHDQTVIPLAQGWLNSHPSPSAHTRHPGMEMKP